MICKGNKSRLTTGRLAPYSAWRFKFIKHMWGLHHHRTLRLASLDEASHIVQQGWFTMPEMIQLALVLPRNPTIMAHTRTYRFFLRLRPFLFLLLASRLLAAASSPQYLFNRADFPTGNSPSSVAVGDFVRTSQSRTNGTIPSLSFLVSRMARWDRKPISP